MSERTIRRVLVANRGEIARRVFATCRRLGIGTVAVHSDVDADAPFVADADLAVGLGGSTPADSYLRGDAIVDAARRAGADAIHPGYGFLAENAAFAQAVLDAGLTWIGPSPAAITAMGSKTEARTRMEAAGVPVLPGRHLHGEAGDALLAAAEEVGYPLLVKASAGGGGKGMRLVEGPDGLDAGVAAARREAAGAFGDDTVFLEHFAPRSRHVEIQIVGDAHGCVASLHERDCSVQRRHQKVIEESPSPAVDESLRAEMSAAAVAAGEALRYVGAGTVEFLLTAEGEFFFLEVNTRLQVEHPVTELVTGLDLVELQLLVAEGAPLPPDARQPQLVGHAIEARLYAEDPAHDFLPVTGALTRFRIPDGVRVDTGVTDGSVISPYYDPMIAKVVAQGATRAQASRRLADALARADVHGLTTNRDFLVRVLRHPEFLAGRADTAFLERHDAAQLAAPLVDAEGERLAAVAAALAGQASRRANARALGSLPSGWRNNPSELQRATFSRHHADELAVGYRLGRDGSLADMRVGEEKLDGVVLRHCRPDEVELEAAGVRRRYRIGTGLDGAVHVNTSDGQVDLRELPRFADATGQVPAGSLTSPMPGMVIRVLAEAGAEVQAGQPLLVVEAMKMEHEIVAPTAGSLADLRVREGAQVEAGAILAVIDEQT
jgi:acetyl/propionyl-CoA carboxylase alpha subunit